MTISSSEYDVQLTPPLPAAKPAPVPVGLPRLELPVRVASPQKPRTSPITPAIGATTSTASTTATASSDTKNAHPPCAKDSSYTGWGDFLDRTLSPETYSPYSPPPMKPLKLQNTAVATAVATTTETVTTTTKSQSHQYHRVGAYSAPAVPGLGFPNSPELAAAMPVPPAPALARRDSSDSSPSNDDGASSGGKNQDSSTLSGLFRKSFAAYTDEAKRGRWTRWLSKNEFSRDAVDGAASGQGIGGRLIELSSARRRQQKFRAWWFQYFSATFCIGMVLVGALLGSYYLLWTSSTNGTAPGIPGVRGSVASSEQGHFTVLQPLADAFTHVSAPQPDNGKGTGEPEPDSETNPNDMVVDDRDAGPPLDAPEHDDESPEHKKVREEHEKKIEAIQNRHYERQSKEMDKLYAEMGKELDDLDGEHRKKLGDLRARQDKVRKEYEQLIGGTKAKAKEGGKTDVDVVAETGKKDETDSSHVHV